MSIDMFNIEYFITVCQYRGSTKTEEVLHISQSAFNHRIQALEED